jgi:hypothetical protein
MRDGAPEASCKIPDAWSERGAATVKLSALTVGELGNALETAWRHAVAKKGRCEASKGGRGVQAVAGAFVATPLSLSRDCSSPDWNISRIMSQPPTNSPLT